MIHLKYLYNPAPVKDIASHVIYVSPAMVVKQQDSGYNNNFTMTPIIAKVFPGMSFCLIIALQ